jgi:hypothetical protein
VRRLSRWLAQAGHDQLEPQRVLPLLLDIA